MKKIVVIISIIFISVKLFGQNINLFNIDSIYGTIDSLAYVSYFKNIAIDSDCKRLFGKSKFDAQNDVVAREYYKYYINSFKNSTENKKVYFVLNIYFKQNKDSTCFIYPDTTDLPFNIYFWFKIFKKTLTLY